MSAIAGPTIGKFCMELAIKKAKEVGVSWVTVKSKCSLPIYILLNTFKIHLHNVKTDVLILLNNCTLDSNHFGIAGFYSMMASKEGLMVKEALN